MLGAAINAVLVDGGVRPGMLLQWVDFIEVPEDCPVTRELVNRIIAGLPDLKWSVQEQGFLISLNEVSDGSIVDDEELGVALGYPCASEFCESFDGPFCVIELYADVQDELVQLMANRCVSPDHKAEFDVMAQAANGVLGDALYTEFLASFGIRSPIRVTVVETVMKTTEDLIDALIENDQLDEGTRLQIQREVRGHVPNLVLDFEEENPVHRGIVIGLLLNIVHDPIEPFYPLTNLSQHRRESVERIVDDWGDSLADVIERTRI